MAHFCARLRTCVCALLGLFALCVHLRFCIRPRLGISEIQIAASLQTHKQGNLNRSKDRNIMLAGCWRIMKAQHSISVATRAEPRGEKNYFLCKFWAVKNF